LKHGGKKHHNFVQFQVSSLPLINYKQIR